jgi:hypothetical protein
VAGCVVPGFVARGEAQVVDATRGVVETAVTAVACGEARVVDSGSCLLDLAISDLCCAATRDLRCDSAALAFACAAATCYFSRAAFARAWFLAANFSNTKAHAAPAGALAVSIPGKCASLSNKT